MIGFVAFDLILRVILAGVMDIALAINVTRMYPHIMDAAPPRLGIPGHVITGSERLLSQRRPLDGSWARAARLGH